MTINIEQLSEYFEEDIESVCHKCQSWCDNECFEGLGYSDNKYSCHEFSNTTDF